MRMGTAALLLTLFAVPAAAQETAPAKVDIANVVPEGWTGRVDRADGNAAGIAFTAMPPGWHITSGPAAIYYQPGVTAEGEYTVRSTTFLFKSSDHAEGYGIFVGGDHLETKGQSYLYFLIRQDGKYLIKRRNGPVTTSLREWTEHDAIVTPEPGSDKPAENTLAISVAGDAVQFLINDRVVDSMPRADLDTDGTVGLRVNHRLNLHVTDLVVSRAPSGKD